MARLLQYRCEVERPLAGDGRVLCVPVERLFRRCKDAKTTFMVETTAWEGSASARPPPNKAGSGGKPLQWSSHWADADEAPR
ncbi:hypothetical protein CDD83_5667 [Cordyceps sp. RAO-2017]|nr:hypothetical protein CDD83_5667 [Cordyceps sp. RAO-2017]